MRDMCKTQLLLANLRARYLAALETEIKEELSMLLSKRPFTDKALGTWMVGEDRETFKFSLT